MKGLSLFLCLVVGGLGVVTRGEAEEGGALAALTRQIPGTAQRASSSNADMGRNGDAKSIAPGETLVLLEAQGPGEVTHFWNTVGSVDFYHGRNIVIRVYYDGAEKPSVEAPLGDFFGVGYGAYKEFTSGPVATSSYGRSRDCHWRMPFRQSIRITATNDAPIKVDSFYYYLDWRKVDSLPEDTLYFHAQYRQEHPAVMGNRYTIADLKGHGQYVGTVLSVYQMETGWFGEGDDFFYIDGAESPQLRGTGTEDYFCDAWGFREFSTPNHGVSLYDGVLTGDRVSAYRWHIEDPIPFKESLRLEIEHKGSIYNDQGGLLDFELGGFEDRADWYSSVAFWYQYPPAQLEGLPAAATRMPPAKTLMASQLAYRADPPFIVLPQDPILMYAPNQAGAYIEFDIPIEKDGRYRIDGIFYFSLMGGAYQPLLDGKKLGAVLDLRIPNADPRWVSLDTHDLKAGTHVLRFEGVDQTSINDRAIAPKFYLFGMAGLSLLRLEDMEGYHVGMQTVMEKRKKGS